MVPIRTEIIPEHEKNMPGKRHIFGKTASNTATSFFLTILSLLIPAAVRGAVMQPATSNTSAGNAFAIDLYKQLATPESDLFFSPSSIETALSMTLSGARGRTEKQMATVMNVQPDAITHHHEELAGFEQQLKNILKKGEITITSSNSIWPQQGYPLSLRWITLMRKYYGSAVTPVDYIRQTEKARLSINRQVEKETKKRVREFIKPGILTPRTRLSLVSAVYFKGDWEHPFNENNTIKSPFYIKRGKTGMAPLMRQSATFGYADRDSLQVLELPYSGKELSMVLILPKETFGLEALEKSMTPERFLLWTSNLHQTKVDARILKFSTTAAFRLDKTLINMGMTDAFSSDLADFSGMDSNRNNLFIGAVVHKAFVDVSEKGTEAAAATAVIMQLKSAMPMPIPVFKTDHPFFFVIRENSSGRILFMGRITDPEHAGN